MLTSRKRYAEFRKSLRQARAAEAGVGSTLQAGGAGTDRRDASKGAKDGAAARGEKGRRKAYFREYLHFLRPFSGRLIVAFSLALVVALMSLVMPRMTMYVIDHVIPAHDLGQLHTIGAALLLWIIVQQGVDFVRNLNIGRLNSRVLMRMRQRLFEHLLRLPLAELSNLKTGGIASRLSTDIDNVSNMMHVGIMTPAVSIAKIIATLAILVWINWQMAVAAALSLPPIVFLNLVSIRRIRPIYRSVHQDRTDVNARVVEVFGGIRVVRAFQREKNEARRFATAHHTLTRKQLLARGYECVVGSLWGLLLPACALMVIWLGGALVLSGRATLGGIMAFQMYLMMLLMPVSTVVQSYGEVQQALAAMERVFELLGRTVDKPDRSDALELPNVTRRGGRLVETFELDHVTFAYDGGRPVLEDVSLKVRGGMTVALVGPSGAGKTTLTNLVARFYDPQGGAIRLNGVDLRDITLASFRRLLGFVQQDVFLFDGTVADNIAYGRRGATQEQIEAAARRANAYEFIKAFPDGLATIVGERGVRLSGGQAQRVSIARALLADPQILILDEATSNLDSESEQLIQSALRELWQDRTTFVIAHRLSTVMDADLIVVVEEGQIRETGRHDELMARNGRYRAMVERQQRQMREAAEVDWLA